MNSCEFNGNKDSYEELNGYIQLFSKKGLIDEKSDSITKLALLVHSDKSPTGRKERRTG